MRTGLLSIVRGVDTIFILAELVSLAVWRVSSVQMYMYFRELKSVRTQAVRRQDQLADHVVGPFARVETDVCATTCLRLLHRIQSLVSLSGTESLPALRRGFHPAWDTGVDLRILPTLCARSHHFEIDFSVSCSEITF